MAGMKKLMVAGSATLATLFAGAALVLAQTNVTLPAGLQMVSGKVFSIDASQKLLRIEAQKQAGATASTQLMDIALADTTVITEAGKQAQPSDIQSGEQVQVTFKVEAGKNIAQTISVGDPGSAVQPSADKAQAPAPASAPKY